jgi:hypothetical protein
LYDPHVRTFFRHTRKKSPDISNVCVCAWLLLRRIGEGGERGGRSLRRRCRYTFSRTLGCGCHGCTTPPPPPPPCDPLPGRCRHFSVSLVAVSAALFVCLFDLTAPCFRLPLFYSSTGSRHPSPPRFQSPASRKARKKTARSNQTPSVLSCRHTSHPAHS